ncbi:MAG: RDD family protein [Desulfobacteraceae bacterium]|nr:RDD family protein [Desulfobacteraceae bacterium]
MNEQIHNGVNQPVVVDDTQTEMLLASKGQRLGNYLIDGLCILLLFALLLFNSTLIGLENIIERIGSGLFGHIFILIYFFFQEAFSGRTIGKLITGTKAVNEDGSKLTFVKALGRTLCRFIPFEFVSFIDTPYRPKGWHDRIPKTKVISIRNT